MVETDAPDIPPSWIYKQRNLARADSEHRRGARALRAVMAVDETALGTTANALAALHAARTFLCMTSH